MLSRLSCLPAHDPAVMPTPSGRAFRNVASLLLAVALTTVSVHAASLETLRGAVADIERGRFQLLDEATARSIAAEAYVWSWPLAYVHKCRVALERVPAPGRSGGMPVAPLNRLSMLTDRASPRVRGVACPNQDVIYGFGMFDLEVSPVILQVPDFGERFWLYQLGDQRTDAFADFGTDYLTRTAVAKSNVFVNRHHETKYYFLDLDSEGRRLDGLRRYRITFPARSLPPARGFWSLTVYDERHALPDAADGRHSLGSRDSSVVFGNDGSLTVLLGPSDGDSTSSAGPAANRLATPDGPFSLSLRLYWPAQSALDGTWTPPPVHVDLASRESLPRDSITEGREVARSRAASQNMAGSLRYVEFAGSNKDSTR